MLRTGIVPGLILGLILACGPVAGPAVAQITGNTLSLPDVTGAAGETVSIPLNLANAEAVGGVQVDLLFDAAVVAFEGIVGSGRGAAMSVEGAGGAGGQARLLLFFTDAGSLASDDGPIANLSFRVIGESEDSTTLQLTAPVLADPEGAALGAVVQSGSLTVLASQDPPTLQIAAFKNPGRTRSLMVMVAVHGGSGNAPTVLAGNTPVTMTGLGGGIFRGLLSLAGAPSSVTLTATDTNSQGEGQDVLVLALP